MSKKGWQYRRFCYWWTMNFKGFGERVRKGLKEASGGLDDIQEMTQKVWGNLGFPMVTAEISWI